MLSTKITSFVEEAKCSRQNAKGQPGGLYAHCDIFSVREFRRTPHTNRELKPQLERANLWRYCEDVLVPVQDGRMALCILMHAEQTTE